MTPTPTEAPGGEASSDKPLREDDDLVALSSRLRYSVARLNRLLRNQDGGGLGATASAALATVSRAGAPTLGELAAHEHVAAPTMTKVVAKLEERGLVRREADPSDGRVSRVVITAVGEVHLEENRSRRTAWLVGRLGDLDEHDVERLAAALPVLELLSTPPARGDR
ncbi:MAG: MarR family transcriptional regulator [Acidimicrobiia bacterium]|nr:MarR family transcriptional regulator [Acidimicrobiia bacterium]